MISLQIILQKLINENLKILIIITFYLHEFSKIIIEYNIIINFLTVK